MIDVVEPDANDLAGARKRRQQLYRIGVDQASGGECPSSLR
jgi:hypothetical protein